MMLASQNKVCSRDSWLNKGANKIKNAAKKVFSGEAEAGAGSVPETNFESEILSSGEEGGKVLQEKYGLENVVWESEGGSSPALKIGSINKTVRSFTREDIINSLEGVTEKSTEIANAIQNKGIGINVLGDELFEDYIGCTSETVGMQIGDQIYVRSSSSSLMSDVVHEGTHALDYFNGIDESVISSWAGETTAYSAERLFQVESGMPVQFVSEEDMMIHIWSNYSR